LRKVRQTRRKFVSSRHRIKNPVRVNVRLLIGAMFGD
jgi:hypothetical protein